MSEAIWRTPCRPRTRGPLGRVHPRDAESPQEVSALKEEHARRMSELQRKHAEEQALASAQQTEALQSCQLHAETAEAQVAQLSRQQQSLQSSGESCRERALQAEKELKEANLEIQELRKQLKVLEEQKFRHEREINELKVQLASVKEQLAVREQHAASQKLQIDEAVNQRRMLEENVSSLKKQASSLEEKFNLSSQEIAKGNRIIQSLHQSSKESKVKLRQKQSELTDLEKARLELEKEGQLSKLVLDEKDQELLRGKHREEKMKEDIDEMKRKLAEAHDVIKSNQEVIEYLNRQLTERELRTMPTVPMSGTANSTFQSDVPSRSGTTSVALAELLSKVESLAPKSKGLPSSPGYGGHVSSLNLSLSTPAKTPSTMASSPEEEFIHFWDDLVHVPQTGLLLMGGAGPAEGTARADCTGYPVPGVETTLGISFLALAVSVNPTGGHDAAVASVAQLFQRLEELSRSMQDDQVCSESELLELRQERNALKDRLEDAVSSLRQLSARAALLQPAAADAGPAGPAEPTAGAGAAEPSELQRRVWQAEGELQELKRMENLRLQRIQTLELHQESLVEQTTWATATSSVSGEDARRTLQSLEQSVAELQASVVAKKDLLEETRERSQKGQRYIQALQQQQLQLVSQADERVLRNPRPPRSATAV
ncbi:unnamed protein product [Durusdinium trenchii]|uniref:Uncharacterized protein n=1 Tax=Durusdinium trenchii TaxID=1381693 RepID=A0ABP0LIN1_9DINO